MSVQHDKFEATNAFWCLNPLSANPVWDQNLVITVPADVLATNGDRTPADSADLKVIVFF